MPRLFVVDAFTENPFAGNPAAVCLLARWPGDEWLHLVGREMNLSETAFLVHRQDNEFDLRWFTPRVEVALCGHATLASAHALWESGQAARELIGFHTRKSGRLTAAPFTEGGIELDFPAQPATLCDPPPGLFEALGVSAAVSARNEFDYLLELPAGADVQALRPDFGNSRPPNVAGSF